MRLTLYYREVSKSGYVFHGKPFPRRDVAKVLRLDGQRVKSVFTRDLPTWRRGEDLTAALAGLHRPRRSGRGIVAIGRLVVG